jgi:cysteine desulfurase / selenocysteine lyase
MKRRKFFHSLGSAVVGTLSLQTIPHQVLHPDILSGEFQDAIGTISTDDERFWQIVRKQFPLTDTRAYFNTGGLGASPLQVIDAVKKKMDELEGVSEVGRTEQEWTTIKKKISDFISADSDEIALTGCCTEGMNIIANGLPLKKGDEVLLSTHEHVGGSLPWLGRQKRDGIHVKTFEPGNSAAEAMRAIRKAVTSKTRVISVSHITCTTGAIFPVREISMFARENKIWSVIDGAQAVGQIPVDVKDYGCDFYATSGHKWMLGPKRTGVLYVRKEIIDLITPVVIGAYSDAGWSFRDGVEYHPTAQRYEYGTYNVPVMHGLGTAVDFLNIIGMLTVYSRCHTLANLAVEGLRDVPNVKILTPIAPNEYASMLTVRLENMDTMTLQRHLAEKYRLRTRYVAEADLDALRISIHLYNSRDEVERFIDGVIDASRL